VSVMHYRTAVDHITIHFFLFKCWRQQAPPKLWYPLISYSVKFQTTMMLTPPYWIPWCQWRYLPKVIA